MPLQLTSFKKRIQIEETHSVDTNCDFSKTVYYARQIEKFGDPFPDWIHEILEADITDKSIHQDEYFKFMQLGKSKRKEFVDFIRNVEIPHSMVHINTNEPINGTDTVAFITADTELKHLSIDEEILGLDFKVTGKMLLYNNKWRDGLEYVRSKKNSNYAFCNHWRKRVKFYNSFSSIFSTLIIAYTVLYMNDMIKMGFNGCDVPCYLIFVGLMLICISYIIKIALLLPLFVFDIIEFAKWKYFLVCTGTSFVGLCCFIIGSCLEDIEQFKLNVSDQTYLFGIIIWMAVIDVLIVTRKKKTIIYYGWLLSFAITYIIASILFLIYDSNTRNAVTVDYVITSTFIVGLICILSFIFGDTEDENCECVYSALGIGFLCAIFAFPVASIFHFAVTDWDAQNALYLWVLITIKSIQILSISVCFVMGFLYGCCGGGTDD